jgi:hypothetical protein
LIEEFKKATFYTENLASWSYIPFIRTLRESIHDFYMGAFHRVEKFISLQNRAFMPDFAPLGHGTSVYTRRWTKQPCSGRIGR